MEWDDTTLIGEYFKGYFNGYFSGRILFHFNDLG